MKYDLILYYSHNIKKEINIKAKQQKIIDLEKQTEAKIIKEIDKKMEKEKEEECDIEINTIPDYVEYNGENTTLQSQHLQLCTQIKKNKKTFYPKKKMKSVYIKLKSLKKKKEKLKKKQRITVIEFNKNTNEYIKYHSIYDLHENDVLVLYKGNFIPFRWIMIKDL